MSITNLHIKLIKLYQRHTRKNILAYLKRLAWSGFYFVFKSYRFAECILMVLKGLDLTPHDSFITDDEAQSIWLNSMVVFSALVS